MPVPSIKAVGRSIHRSFVDVHTSSACEPHCAMAWIFSVSKPFFEIPSFVWKLESLIWASIIRTVPFRTPALINISLPPSGAELPSNVHLSNTADLIDFDKYTAPANCLAWFLKKEHFSKDNSTTLAKKVLKQELKLYPMAIMKILINL